MRRSPAWNATSRELRRRVAEDHAGAPPRVWSPMHDTPAGPVDPHANRNLALLILVLLALAGALLAPWFLHHFVDRAGAQDIQDLASLPERITACGREWQRPQVLVTTTLAEAQARSGVEPVVVDVAPFAPCPAGPCTRIAADAPCSTVVFVRVGTTDYVAYELLGGP